MQGSAVNGDDRRAGARKKVKESSDEVMMGESGWVPVQAPPHREQLPPVKHEQAVLKSPQERMRIRAEDAASMVRLRLPPRLPARGVAVICQVHLQGKGKIYVKCMRSLGQSCHNVGSA